MNSKLIAIAAVTGLLSLNSFAAVAPAEFDASGSVQSYMGTKSRAEVQADWQQARASEFSTSAESGTAPASATPAMSRNRADVRAEARGAARVFNPLSAGGMN